MVSDYNLLEFSIIVESESILLSYRNMMDELWRLEYSKRTKHYGLSLLTSFKAYVYVLMDIPQ